MIRRAAGIIGFHAIHIAVTVVGELPGERRAVILRPNLIHLLKILVTPEVRSVLSSPPLDEQIVECKDIRAT
jgi:hypothetical protein